MLSFKSAGTTAGNVAAGSCAEPDRPRSWRGRAKGIEISGVCARAQEGEGRYGRSSNIMT
jgi:hypothetical protein